MTKKSVLLVNLGTPETATESGVKKFLKPFLSDSRVVGIPKVFWLPILNFIILPLRCKKVSEAYNSIWLESGSPLLHYSLLQKEALNRLFKDKGLNVDVDLAMTYGERSIHNAINKLKGNGSEHIIILPLFPQYSSTTTAPVFDQIASYIKKNVNIPSISMISNYHSHPSYINALSHSIESHWAEHGRAEKLLFSYHGIPQALIDKGDVYEQHCLETTKLVCKKLQISRSDIIHSYQSRFGKAQWLKPYTQDTLIDIAKSGTQSIDVICPAFSSDCLETLEEMKIKNKAEFIDAGGKQYNFISCLNDSKHHITALFDIVNEKATINTVS